MSSEYSVEFDCQEAWKNPDKWVNHGRSLLEEACKHKTQDTDSNKENRETNMRYSGYCEECEESEDSATPMMNYAYPLYIDPSEEQILEVVKKTCLTVMENNDTGKYYLVLCGGGMDLSQNIGLAYLLTDRRIPFALACEICTQPNMNLGGKDFRKVMRACKDEMQATISNTKYRLKQINKSIRNSLEMDKKKLTHVS